MEGVEKNLSKSELSDSDLIEACLQGRETAWDNLLNRYQALIYSIPFKYGMSQTDADDIFSSVCFILLDKLPTLRDQNRLASWLIVTTQRECWRLGRKYRRVTVSADLALDKTSTTSETALDLVADEKSLPEDEVVLLTEQQLIRQGLIKLDERCRQLLELLYYNQAPPAYQAIATQFGISEGSIGPTRARCLKKLREYLETNGF
jgi:RNA polymerase sigma factor (sigma-70 family)